MYLAFSYCSETLTEARKTGLCLAREIKECVRWQVVCVDPEHLRDKEWREITEGPIFRSNVLFACVDEAHLINSWGLSFRSAFSLIGTFLRGRFPSSISILGLTATLGTWFTNRICLQESWLFRGKF
jgi:superfamily II DNA helicase RecQ